MSSKEEVDAYNLDIARRLAAPPETLDQPVLVGVKYSLCAVLVSVLIAACAAIGMRELNQTAWMVGGGLSGVSVCVAFAYSFIAWKWGKAKARLVATLLICALALAGFLVLNAHISPR